MQRIVPTMWMNDTAEDAVNFYEEVFGAVPTRTDYYTEAGKDQHGHTPGDIVTIEFEIDGFRMIALNGGSIFAPNPSISFSLTRDSIESVDELWRRLSDSDSKELMPLDAYPFSERYGWIQDKFGVSWQISVSESETQTPPTPSLLFVGDQAGNAEAAMSFYASIFPGSTNSDITRYPSGSEPDREGTVMYGEVALFGQKLIAMDSAVDHKFQFSEGVSLLVECSDQAEIDRYWSALSAHPESEQCGWLKDKFGVSWQIIPTVLNDMLANGTNEQIERVTAAYMEMGKFDISKLQAAYEG